MNRKPAVQGSPDAALPAAVPTVSVVDPEGILQILRATGVDEEEALRNLYEIEDPACRAHAALRFAELARTLETVHEEDGKGRGGLKISMLFRRNLRLCPDLVHQSFPHLNGLVVHNGLNLANHENLQGLPENLTVTYKLNLSDCPYLYDLPPGLKVEGNCDLSRTAITKLPPDLLVTGMLDISECTQLRDLPSTLRVGGRINACECTSLTGLPEKFHVKGILLLSGCTSLERLPDGLKVEEDLILKGCRALKRLPRGLQVGGDLVLIGCTAWDLILPKDAVVQGALYTDNHAVHSGGISPCDYTLRG